MTPFEMHFAGLMLHAGELGHFARENPAAARAQAQMIREGAAESMEGEPANLSFVEDLGVAVADFVDAAASLGEAN